MRTGIKALAAIALAAAASATPAYGASGPVTANDCQEHQGFVDGDAAAVAARLPAGYAPERDPASGQPLVYGRAIHCTALTVDGRTGPATMGNFGVVVESPDGKGCASGAPVIGSVDGDVPPICNWYPLSWVADSRRAVAWLRAAPGLPATYVPRLSFRLGAFDPAVGGEPFVFAARRPAPSPFALDDVGRERPGAISVRGGYWAQTPQGRLKLAFSTDDLTSGDATGTVRAAPGSDLAALMGAATRPYLPGLSLFAAERWSHATYEKQLAGG